MHEIQGLQCTREQECVCPSTGQTKVELIGLSSFFNGTSIVVSNQQRDCYDYQAAWATDISLPGSFENDHLHTKFNKGNKEDYQAISSSRIAYDKEYPEAKGKGPLHLCHEISGTPHIAGTDLDIQNNTGMEHVLTTARVLPSIKATTNAIMEVLYNNLDIDLTSDDGSNFEEGGACFPVNEESDLINSTYNPSFMEEDGNYDDLLSGLSFQYSDLFSELSPPANRYNSRGPCL